MLLKWINILVTWIPHSIVGLERNVPHRYNSSLTDFVSNAALSYYFIELFTHDRWTIAIAATDTQHYKEHLTVQRELFYGGNRDCFIIAPWSASLPVAFNED